MPEKTKETKDNIQFDCELLSKLPNHHAKITSITEQKPRNSGYYPILIFN